MQINFFCAAVIENSCGWTIKIKEYIQYLIIMKQIFRVTIISIISSLIVIAGFVSSCGIFGTYSNQVYAKYYSTCFWYKGQWSSWEKHYFGEYDTKLNWTIRRSTSYNGHITSLSIGDDSGFKYFAFYIPLYKEGQKEFTGTVEYYVNDQYPTAEAISKACNFVRPNYRSDTTPSVKRTARATIKIVNSEEEPAVFNIWFDNIGVAIDVRNVYWHN